MDFQNRVGGKTGSGGVASSSETNRDRRERLRQLALETIDLNKVLTAYCIDNDIKFYSRIFHSEIAFGNNMKVKLSMLIYK